MMLARSDDLIRGARHAEVDEVLKLP